MRIKKILNALYPFVATIIGMIIGYFMAIQSFVLEGLINAVHIYNDLENILTWLTLLVLIVTIINLVYQFVVHEKTKFTWMVLSFLLGGVLSMSYFSIDTLQEIIRHAGILYI